MQITRREATEALALRHVTAFLRVIRRGESDVTNDARAYSMRWGGLGKPPASFSDFSRHPRIFEPTTGGRKSSAAGAYQITATTYDDFAPKLGIDDFSPNSQDLIAVAIIAAEGALAPILAGNFDEAVALLRNRWTSLPGAEENNPTWTIAAARETYRKWGGTLAEIGTQPAAPIEDRSTPYKEQKVPFPLIPLIMAFGPAIAQMIPQIAKLFLNPEKPKDSKTLGAIQVVFDTVQQITGSSNLQSAVEAMQASEEVKTKVVQAVVTQPVILEVLEISSSGIEKAREANTALIASADKWWKLVINPVLLVTMMVLPLVYIIVLELVKFMFKVSPDVIAQTIGTVIGLVLGGVMGFWMGQVYQQRKEGNRSTDQPKE